MEQQPINQILSQSQNVGPPHPPPLPKTTSINAANFGTKYASKREGYRFLTSEARIYLPAYETVTIFHMRDIVAGRRRMIK